MLLSFLTDGIDVYYVCIHRAYIEDCIKQLFSMSKKNSSLVFPKKTAL